MSQLVDPAVSKAKFTLEVNNFRSLQVDYERRGWWLKEAEFPHVLVAFITPNCTPRLVATAALLDFTNYDLWPPSVSFVDPFTKLPVLKGNEISEFPKVDPNAPTQLVTAAKLGQAPLPIVNLLQGYPGKPVFLCHRGVREYHDHPGHTGDSWLLHRSKGEGGLFRILDIISRYGSEPLDLFQLAFRPLIKQSSYPE